MRWERLFDDLEAQWTEGVRAQSQAEIADRTRRERATVALVDRLAAHQGSLEVLVLGGRRIGGEVADIGGDFVLLREGVQQRLVPLSSLVQLTGLTRYSAGARSVAKVRRFGVGSALRVIARDRAPVLIDDALGRSVTGTIEVVGADHLELSEHPLDLPGRPEAVVGRRVLPFGAVVCVSSD